MSQLPGLLYKAIDKVYTDPYQLEELCLNTIGQVPTDLAWTDSFKKIAVAFGRSMPVRKNMTTVAEHVVSDGEGFGYPEVDALKAYLEATKQQSETAPADAAVEGARASAALESIVNTSIAFNDLHIWTERLQQIGRAVCLVRTPSSTGTGFLVAPDLVLTNYHVVQSMIGDANAPGDAAAVFDYRAAAGRGRPVDQGTEMALAADWLVDHSPYDDADLSPGGLDVQRDPQKLDYALLRLEQPATANGRTPLALPDAVNLAPRRPMFIIQHPDGRPIKLAFAESGIIAVTRDGLRIRHAVNTLGGSSGSPCLDADLNPIALHHAGDPAWHAGAQASHNSAIPLDLVKRLLSSRGHAL